MVVFFSDWKRLVFIARRFAIKLSFSENIDFGCLNGPDPTIIDSMTTMTTNPTGGYDLATPDTPPKF